MIPDWLQSLKDTRAHAKVPGVHWIVPPCTMDRLIRAVEAAVLIEEGAYISRKGMDNLTEALHGKEEPTT